MQDKAAEVKAAEVEWRTKLFGAGLRVLLLWTVANRIAYVKFIQLRTHIRFGASAYEDPDDASSPWCARLCGQCVGRTLQWKLVNAEQNNGLGLNTWYVYNALRRLLKAAAAPNMSEPMHLMNNKADITNLVSIIYGMLKRNIESGTQRIDRRLYGPGY